MVKEAEQVRAAQRAAEHRAQPRAQPKPQPRAQPRKSEGRAPSAPSSSATSRVPVSPPSVPPRVLSPTEGASQLHGLLRNPPPERSALAARTPTKRVPPKLKVCVILKPS